MTHVQTHGTRGNAVKFALRTVSALTVLLMVAGSGLSFGFSSQNNLTALGGALALAGGGLLALITIILGAVASPQRRHFGWLAGLIAAGLVSVVGAPLAAVILQF